MLTLTDAARGVESMAIIFESRASVSSCPLCRGTEGRHGIGCPAVPLRAVRPELDAAEACLRNGTTREAVVHLLEAVRRLNELSERG